MKTFTFQIFVKSEADDLDDADSGVADHIESVLSDYGYDVVAIRVLGES